jgi:hypothetical protein
MTNRTDFFREALSAAQELFTGSWAAWITKISTGSAVVWGGELMSRAGVTIKHSVEAATTAIILFIILTAFDAILGVMRQIKKNRQPHTVNVPIKAWRVLSGPAAKWLVGGIALLASSFIDGAVFGIDSWVGGPVLKFSTGIAMGAIGIEVAAKVDYLLRWGWADKLRKRFPELFSHD